jgi:hypothetical protein
VLHQHKRLLLRSASDSPRLMHATCKRRHYYAAGLDVPSEAADPITREAAPVRVSVAPGLLRFQACFQRLVRG